MVMAFLLSVATQQAQANAVELTAANFKSELEGKSALVMFKASWCGHCKSMLPAFNEVGALYNGPDSSVLVAYVECTAEADLCSKHGVSGYPTLKVFDATTGMESGKDFQGGRDAAALKSYIEENLKAKCSAKDQSGCSEKEKGFLSKMQGSSKAELEDQITRLDKMKGSAMAPELKKWVFQRLTLLKELSAKA